MKLLQGLMTKGRFLPVLSGRNRRCTGLTNFISQMKTRQSFFTRTLLHSDTGSADGGTGWSLRQFHQQADEFLTGVLDQLETAGEDVGSRMPEFDVEYSAGVLTLKLGAANGTYVLNKQPPNKQIWFSSPISGPKRFDFNQKTLQWTDQRTGELLPDLLGRELSHCLKYSIRF